MSTRLPSARGPFSHSVRDTADPDTTLPAAHPTASEPPPRPPAGESLLHRIQRVTAEGGLTKLPETFEDTDGDWQVIKFDDPFTILYLDSEQHERITEPMVARHYELLRVFWNDKVRMVRQGNVRVVAKFTGPHGSASLLEEFLVKLDGAFARISSAAGIRECREETERARVGEKQAKGRTELALVLTGMLEDGLFDTQNWTRLVRRGTEFGLTDEDVALLVGPQLRAANMSALHPVYGETEAQRIASSPWGTPERLAEVRIAAVGPVQPGKGVGVLAIGLLVLLLAGAAVAAVIWSGSSKDVLAPEAVPAATDASIVAPQDLEPTAEDAAKQPNKTDVSRSKPEKTVEETAPRPNPVEPQPAKPDPAEVAARERIEHSRANVVALAARVEDELRNSMLASARDDLAAAEAIVRQHPQALGAEILTVADLRRQLDAAVSEQQIIEAKQAATRAELEQQLREIEATLARSENMNANNLARALAANPNAPADIRERALGLAKTATERAQDNLEFEVGRETRKRKSSGRKP